MPSTRCTHLMAVPGQLHCIDLIDPDTGRTCVLGETPEQVQARNPGAQLIECTAFDAARRAALEAQYMRPPVEVDAERWHDMLNVLPPDDWRGGIGTESFKMCERQTDDWTSCFVRIGSRYWELTRRVSASHADLVNTVREHLQGQQTAAAAFGFQVHTEAAREGADPDLVGRWWWTLTRPGWSGIETDPDSHDTEAQAWAAAIAAHAAGLGA